MKKLLLLAMLALAPAVQALQIEVRPLALQAKVEVMGLRLEADGQKAIIMTGKAAVTVARAAGYTLNAATEMIILTGREVDLLIDDSLVGVEIVGKDAVIITAKLAQDSLNMVDLAVRDGASVLVFAADATIDVGGKILQGLGYTANHAVILVKDAGIFVFNAGEFVVKDIFNFFGDIGRAIGL